MLRESFQFLADELNKYFTLKLGPSPDGDRIVLGNAARAYDPDTLSGSEAIINKGIISIINVEEDRVSKNQENYIKTDVMVKYKNPPLFLNLYALVSINRNNYAQSLTWLSIVLQFFQFQNVFSPITHPSLDPKIKKLIVELYTLNFEQVNHLWSTLGGKYLPSAVYRIRQVILDEEFIVSGAGLIKEFQLEGKSKQPVAE